MTRQEVHEWLVAWAPPMGDRERERMVTALVRRVARERLDELREAWELAAFCGARSPSDGMAAAGALAERMADLEA